TARDKREPLQKAGVDLAQQIEIERGFCGAQASSVEARGAARAERSVVGALDVEQKLIFSVAETEVDIPALPARAYARGHREIVDVTVDLRQKPVRINLGDDRIGLLGKAVKPRGAPVAMRDATEAVERRVVAQWQLHVVEHEAHGRRALADLHIEVAARQAA